MTPNARDQRSAASRCWASSFMADPKSDFARKRPYTGLAETRRSSEWNALGLHHKYYGDAHWARFHATSVVPCPIDATGLVSLSSSPVIVNMRFWFAPFQFGNELLTT